MLRHVDVNHLAVAQFHDDEDLECREADGVLDAEVAYPDGIGWFDGAHHRLVLEEGAPGHGVAPRAGGPDHVLADCRRRVLDPLRLVAEAPRSGQAEFQLQFEGDAVFPVLGMAWPS